MRRVCARLGEWTALVVALCVSLLPTLRVRAAEGNPEAPATPEVARPAGTKTTQLSDVVVEAEKPLSAASSEEIRAADYELRPHDTAREILNNVPGLVVAQHQGGGKATQYLIRGFDADHGTDFAVSVDDLPVNLPTHAHGQGYADLNFVIPETIDRLQLRKGPYFADVGDFGNAGALNVVTKDQVEESYGHADGGSFDTQRYVAVASPKLSWAKSLLAAQASFTNGPFVNPQHFASYAVFSKLTVDPTPESKLSFEAGAYDGDWDSSGQIPLRAVQQGVGEFDSPVTKHFGRFDAIDPSEGGSSDRENLNVHFTYTPTGQDEWAFQVYASRYKLQLFSDFTFFRDTGKRFARLADNSVCDTKQRDCGGSQDYIPGDGIEQNDQRELYGGRATYTRYWSVADLPLQSQVAVETRNDDINVALHRQVQRRRFFTVNDLDIAERSVSGYLRQQVFLAEWARLELGLRGDVFFFDGQNRLPNVGNTDPNFTATAIAGHRINSIVSPKANLIITPVADTDVYFNFGNGFHSNDARNALLTHGHNEGSAALAQSVAYEVGTRTRQFDRLDLAASLWLLDLESELVFSGDAGAQETGATFQPSASGSSRRWGVDFETRYELTDWLFADYDLSWADPRFKNGDAIPLAPTLMMNGGVTAGFGNGFSTALRVRYLGDRPAIEDRSLSARGYALLDLLAKYRWRNIETSLALLNLTDADWREAQFGDNTCLYGEIGKVGGCSSAPGKPGAQTNPPADIHFTPGNPFGVRGGLTVYF